ncbi:MerC mercury resistance protein [Parasphingorhabdus marina DSM 22363]|uniref:MerC mercury resistance protein n=2 Tax=Parasphingorhabdus marina TaxID=394732 RepID=A0A1N6EI36_9SPHN|nr:MerC mercury resistance protein [Parasphingorhabdus marina DSM 22363]
MQSAFYKDGAAIALSTACMVHCVALPVLAISSPVFAAVAEAEWVHWSMAVLAILASTSVVLSSPSSRVPEFLVPAGLGGLLITAALFAERFGIGETIPTVAGAVLIVSAHLLRLYKIRRS